MSFEKATDLPVLGQRLIEECVAEEGYDLVSFGAQHEILCHRAVRERILEESR